MLALLSPAKTLDFESPAPAGLRTTRPRLLDDSRELADILRHHSVAGLRDLMGVSEALAELNHERFATWTDRPARGAARPAILAFRGDVYRGFDVDTLDVDDLQSAQRRVRILSGLYGVLRPLDAMLPHRLEMGTPLSTDRGTTLYAFWGDRITRLLAADVKAAGSEVVVNLASNEYARAVQADGLPVPMVTPVFRDVKDGKSRSLALFAKEARGMMARFIAAESIDDAAGLKDFRLGGYRFRASDSTDREYVFSRPQPAPRGAAARKKAASRSGR
jgi:cytoplasmic iron level regulating protein YaaA (DUF328/UPF0246 family)